MKPLLNITHNPHRSPLSITAVRRVSVNLMIGLALITFIIGVSAPMLTLQKLIWITNTFSLLSGVFALFGEGQYLLFVLIFGFSILLPAFKIVLLFSLWNRSVHLRSRSIKYFHWLTLMGKWSMLDVFVVAVLLASIKLGAFASVEIHYGLYCFALAVILMMLATHQVAHHVGHLDNVK